MPAAIAGNGTCSIRRAPSTASRATQSAENAPASGERAPASRLSPERVKEPADRLADSQGPSRFDRPWARTSWLASNASPWRAARARAIDRLVTSPSMPQATAAGNRSRIDRDSKTSGFQPGSALDKACTWATEAKVPGSAQTSVAPPSKPSSRAGQRGRRRLTSRLSAKLKPPTSSDGPSNSANRASSRQPFPGAAPSPLAARPRR